MPVIGAAQSVKAARNALLDALVTLFAGSTGTDGSPVLVVKGPPGQNQPSAIVALGHVRSLITRPTMGTSRSRESAAEFAVLLSVYTPGDESIQATSTDCAVDLLALMESYLRTSPNERLAGGSWDALVSEWEMDESVAGDVTSGAPTGRLAEIAAVVTCRIRY